MFALSNPRTDADLRHVLQTLVAKGQTTVTIDDTLLDYLMTELKSRTDLTPVQKAPEVHKSIYIYCILHAIAKSFNSSGPLLRVLAKRYIAKTKGSVDYSIR